MEHECWRRESGLVSGSARVIEFTGCSHAQLRPGDRGVVRDISETGDIIVSWERGFALQIDPDTTPFRSVPA